MLSTVLTWLLIVVALLLILLIIGLQHGNEGGIGSAFGSGNTTGFFGASGGVALITRATWVVGTLFFLLSTALAWVKTHDHFGVGRELDTEIGVPALPDGDAAPPAASAPGTPAPAPSPAAEGLQSAPENNPAVAPSPVPAQP